MTDKRPLKITLTGPAGCGKSRMADLLHFVFTISELNVININGSIPPDFTNEAGTQLLEWFRDNVDITIDASEV